MLPHHTLHTGLQAHGKLYWGVSISPADLLNSLPTTTITQNFNQITPENALKWSSTQPVRGEYTFTDSDALVSFAQSHSMKIRGHTLLWHRSLPLWVSRITCPSELEAVIIEHIHIVVGRYAGRIYAWDVVNEPFTDEGGLRENHFYQVLGQRYVKIAFRAAREADRGARLYLNDYMTARAKISGAVEFIEKWKGEGERLEIDGVGVQGHVSKGESGRMGWTLKLLADVVDEVAITELDIVDAGEEEYVEVVRACLEVEKCVGITSWGVRDEESWRREGRPLLFEGEWLPKPAYHAVVRCLCEE